VPWWRYALFQCFSLFLLERRSIIGAPAGVVCVTDVKYDVIYLQETLDEATENWGIMVERVEM